MKTTLLKTPPPQREEGGGGGSGGLQEDRAKMTTDSSGFQSHLELRLGISMNSGPEDMVTTTTTTSIHDGKSGAVGPISGLLTTPEGLLPHQRNGVGSVWPQRWFSESGNGFVHPWSLAARQQKAVFEKAHHKPNASLTVPRAVHRPLPPPPPPPVVGWPPVRTFRKNLVGPHPPRSEMEGEKDAKRTKTAEGEAAASKAREARLTMYVKVNMEGYAVGRKINLKAHDSYESLSRALQRMFNNFLSSNYSNNSKQEEEDNAPTPDHLLIYEDHEGDRMLVGDVPWEIFLNSVKRLYIAHTPRGRANADGRVAEDKH